jgi:hypothetical protein
MRVAKHRNSAYGELLILEYVENRNHLYIFLLDKINYAAPHRRFNDK